MTEEQDHAKPRAPQPEPEPKSPSSLPGPNRFPDTDRVGEALAPGTIPDEERKERERRREDKREPANGVDKP